MQFLRILLFGNRGAKGGEEQEQKTQFSSYYKSQAPSYNGGWGKRMWWISPSYFNNSLDALVVKQPQLHLLIRLKLHSTYKSAQLSSEDDYCSCLSRTKRRSVLKPGEVQINCSGHPKAPIHFSICTPSSSNILIGVLKEYHRTPSQLF